MRAGRLPFPVATVLATIVTLLPAGAQVPGLRAGYVTIGEGVTSQSLDDDMEVASRMFSLGDFAEICAEARATLARLGSSVPRVQLFVGQPFLVGSLKTVALDAAGAVLQKVPVMVEVRAPQGMFDSRGDAFSPLVDGTLIATRPGPFRFRIRTICNGSVAETFVSAEISH
jgi:hypothetical protein